MKGKYENSLYYFNALSMKKEVIMIFKTNTDKQIIKYNKRLNQIGKRGIPLAAANTLDNMAFESRKISIKMFKKDRIIRSNWTQRGMLFEKTKKGIPIRQMEARSGNIRDYAVTQEFGDTITANSQFIPIPALGSRISKSKHKRIAKKFSMPLKARRMPNISGSHEKRFTAMLNIARKERYYGPFLITKQDAGGFKLPVGLFNLGKQGRGRRGGGKIIMIRKLQSSVRVPGNPFIAPAGVKVTKRMDRFYIHNAKQILKRYGRDIR